MVYLQRSETSSLTAATRPWDAPVIWSWATGSRGLPGQSDELMFLRDSNPLTDWDTVDGDLAKEIRRLGDD